MATKTPDKTKTTEKPVKTNFKKGAEDAAAKTTQKASKPAAKPKAAKTPPADKKKAAPPANAKPTAKKPKDAAPEPDAIEAEPVLPVEPADAVDAAIIAPDRLETAMSLGGAELEIRKLSADEQTQLEEYEMQVEAGLKGYIGVGKPLFAIWEARLFTGSHTSFRKYVKERWKINPTGAYDLMRAYRTWVLASSPEHLSFKEAIDPTRLLNGKPETDAGDAPPTGKPPATDKDAPSQRAIEEMAKLTGFLNVEGLTPKAIEKFEKTALAYFYETAIALSGGKLTEKSVKEIMEGFIEFAKSRSFEIDGEQVDVSLADFRITTGLLEKLKADKDAIRTYWEERRARLSAPQHRTDHKEYDMTPDPNAEKGSVPELQFVRCSHHGDVDIIKLMFGAVQLSCGDVFGIPQGATEIVFNPKLTADNPIEDGDGK